MNGNGDDPAWARLGRLLPGQTGAAPGVPRTKKAKVPTFAQAKARLLNELMGLGWDVSPQLKIPHATSPDRRIRLWFKPQAVWYTGSSFGGHHDFSNARTISYSLDTRTLPVAQLIAAASDRIARDQANPDLR